VTERKSRIFSESELKEMGIETVNLIQQAIDAGEYEKAKKLTRRMHREFFSQHDSYINWVASLLSYIYRHNGDHAVYEAIYESFEQLATLADAYRGQDLGRQAQMLAAGFRGHLIPLEVQEDDEKFTLTMPLCGSGGRLITGKSYEPPKSFAKIEDAQKMTFNKRDFPIYCAHCSLQDIIPMEKTGYPLWVIDIPEKVGEEPCKFYIYKDADKIPARFYERYGLKKPSAESGDKISCVK
jgi:hypothetical protein